jgi:intracellular multiplication protein IcmP
VAFALHFNEHWEDAAALLDTVSVALASEGSASGDGPPAPLAIPADVLIHVRRLVADPVSFAEAQAITAKHAYTAPALMDLLNAARMRHGVLAPAQFAWLKLVDRPLWYALHSLGFETEGVGRYLHPNPRVEAAGARDHWAAECAVGEPLPIPSVARALAALQRQAARRSPPLGGKRTS